MVSNDINQVDLAIRQIGWKVSSLNFQKSKAMSLTEFYECSKLIRKEKGNLVTALLQYKKLEQEHDLPVKLEYRSVLKKLLK